MGKMDGKITVVTGSNTGIGKETARGLAEQGATVVLAVRDVEKGKAAQQDIQGTTGNANVAVMPLDLASAASIRAFARAFEAAYPRLDVLVNNAGVWTRTQSQTADGFESTFGVNHLGTFLLTRELLPRLRAAAPARVVNVSSDLHYRAHLDWSDLQFERRGYSGVQAYNESKLCNVLFTAELAERLAADRITVNALHPGVVGTDLTRELPRVVAWVWKKFTLTPAEGARTSIYLATSPEVEGVTGKYFAKSREKPASADGRDRDAQKRLWSMSEELLGLTRREAAA
jgi:NAD(P)-dependent dehydrogenase (short-subunit alcohol dehydrogenase family)